MAKNRTHNLVIVSLMF